MSYLSPISRLSDALANLERLTEWIERSPRSVDIRPLPAGQLAQWSYPLLGARAQV
jgi:hypothetical protein